MEGWSSLQKENWRRTGEDLCMALHKGVLASQIYSSVYYADAQLMSTFFRFWNLFTARSCVSRAIYIKTTTHA